MGIETAHDITRGFVQFGFVQNLAKIIYDKKTLVVSFGIFMVRCLELMLINGVSTIEGLLKLLGFKHRVIYYKDPQEAFRFVKGKPDYYILYQYSNTFNENVWYTMVNSTPIYPDTLDIDTCGLKFKLAAVVYLPLVMDNPQVPLL